MCSSRYVLVEYLLSFIYNFQILLKFANVVVFAYGEKYLVVLYTAIQATVFILFRKSVYEWLTYN